LDGGAATLVVKSDAMAAFAQPGFIFYQQDATLFAQAFDTSSLRVSGDPIRLADDVLFNRTTAKSTFSVSDTGILAFRVGQLGGPISDLAWLGRDGKQIGVVGDPAAYNQVRLSPDEKRVVITRLGTKSGALEMWTLDLSSNITSQLTFDEVFVNDPVWT